MLVRPNVQAGLTRGGKLRVSQRRHSMSAAQKAAMAAPRARGNEERVVIDFMAESVLMT
jgi:hypothetical protein